MNDKLYDFFLNSFLNPLLSDNDITDIYYNGRDIFYQSNSFGRQKSDLKVDPNYINNFIRQIANMSEKLFSISNPILDVSIRNFRINAVHGSIAKQKYEKVITFAIRKASNTYNVDSILNNLPQELIDYFKNVLSDKKSIIICGNTGSGKTEWQKYLISLIEDNTRLIVIDNIEELSIMQNEKLDITFWQVDENNSHIDLNGLISNSLRFNPDWTIIAESRGKEMNAILTSVLTGHPIILTMHAKSLKLIPSRIMQMILQNESAIRDTRILEKNIYSAFNVGVHIEIKKINGKVIRYIDEIREFLPSKRTKIIYKYKGSDLDLL
ncbi:MAG: type II/IV secretion system ATPase subunit [Erysipelotrichales bacterium]|nr:type II/IV secretion system ATPase subunit [Erysipelotrichales bacterium]